MRYTIKKYFSSKGDKSFLISMLGQRVLVHHSKLKRITDLGFERWFSDQKSEEQTVIKVPASQYHFPDFFVLVEECFFFVELKQRNFFDFPFEFDKYPSKCKEKISAEIYKTLSQMKRNQAEQFKKITELYNKCHCVFLFFHFKFKNRSVFPFIRVNERVINYDE